MAGPVDPFAAHTLRRMYGVDQPSTSERLASTTLDRMSAISELGSGRPVDPAALQQIDNNYKSVSSELADGLRRGGYSMGAAFRASAGQLIENVAPEYGRTMVQNAVRDLQNMPSDLRPTYQTFDEAQAAGLRGLAQYGAGVLGEGASSIGANVAGGLLGRGLFRAAGRSGLAGQIVGGTAASLPAESGETALEMAQDPNSQQLSPAQRTALMLGRGVASAALESAVPAMTTERILGNVARTAPGLRPALGNVGRTAALGAAGEYGTEFTQDLTGQAALMYANPDRQFDFAKANEAGIRGAIVGGVFGGAGGAIQSAVDNVGAGADTVRDNLPKSPKLDDVIGKFRDLAENPQKFGADAANMTLDAFSKAPGMASEAATAARQGLGRGLESASDGLVQVKSYVDDFINKNISPENREWYMQQSANLESMTAGEWKLFTSALQEQNLSDAREGLVTSAKLFGDKAVSGGRALMDWASEVYKGAKSAVSNRRKDSLDAKKYDEADQKFLSMFIANNYSSVNEALPTKSSDRTSMYNILLSAADNPRWLETGAGKQAAQGWKQMTGTDLGEFVTQFNAQRNDETLTGALTGLGDFMSKRGIDQKYTPLLQELSKRESYDSLSPSEKRMLTLMSKNDQSGLGERREFLAKAAGAESYASLTAQQKKNIDDMAGKDLGAKDRGRSLFNEIVGTVNSRLQSQEAQMPGRSSGPLSGLTEQGEGVAADDSGMSIVDEERSTPFNVDAFRQSLVQDKFKNNPNTSIDVTLEADGVAPSALANLFGKRTGRESFEPFKEGEVKDDAPLKMKINPMSLAMMVKDARFREMFAADVGEFNPNMSVDRQTGNNFVSALGALVNNGIEVPAEMVGGKPGDAPVKIKVSADLSKLPNSMVLSRKGDRNYTFGDWSGANQLAMSLNNQQRMLAEVAGKDGEFKTANNVLRNMAQRGDKLAERLNKIAYAKAASKSDGRPTAAQIAEAFKELQNEVKGKVADRAFNEKINQYVDAVGNAYQEGVLTDDDIELITNYLYAGKGANLKDAMSAFGKLGMRPPGRKVGDPSLMADRILMEVERAQAAQARSEAIQYGNADASTDATQEEFDMYKLTPLERANTEKAAAVVRDAERGRATKTTKEKTQPEQGTRKYDQSVMDLQALASEIDVKKLPPKAFKRLTDLLNVVGNNQELTAAQINDASRLLDWINERKDKYKRVDPAISEASKKKFLEIVERILGKRVAVKFDQRLTSANDPNSDPSGQFWTREAALEDVRERRRKALDDNDQKKVAELNAEEKQILEDKAILGFIRVAAGREGQGGLAEHEAFHGAFEFFFNKDERRIIATAFSRGLVLKQLREYFKDNPVRLAAIERDPEEAAAYGFQLWATNPELLKIGPQVKTLFDKFKDFLRKIFGVLTIEERAEIILNDLVTGRRAEQGTSPLTRVLDKDKTWQERAQKYAQDLYDVVMSGYDVLLTPVYERMLKTENPMLAKIAKLGYEATGEEGNQGGMVQRGRFEYKRYVNQADKIFKGLSDEELKELHDAKIFDKRPTNAKLADRFDQLTALYKDLYDYQTAAGVTLKNAGVEENYYPLTWDPEKVIQNKDAFLAMLAKPEYADKMAELKKTPNELWEGITSYIERGEDLVNVMGESNEPLAEHVRKRTLGFITKEDRRAFMTDDPMQTTARYVKQAVRQAEYVRSFGMRGDNLREMLAEARERYGATKEQLSLAQDYIDGLIGNKEVGMSRELKDLYGAINVYQNYRLLPFSLFSSLVDPMGIAVRSNSIGDAWGAFTYSLKNLFRDWKEDYTRDEWQQLTEDWGIIEAAGTTINAENMYTGVTLRGTTKKLNDALFKYNLLDGWIRSNTIMAVKSAQLFMQRSAEGFFKGEGQNERYLDELGVTKDDIIYDKNLGRLLLRKEELMAAGKNEADATAIETRLRNATEKFVRQALLNPSAAELPNWASNPYLMPIAQLKQFVFAFNATITNRVLNEMDYGNYKPMLTATMYVPAMIAADFMKDMVSNAGEEPAYKKNWGFSDYLMHGVDRSGFTGVGQFFGAAKEDIARGGGGFESFVGPTLNQMQKGVSAITSGSSTEGWNFMVKSMPLMPAYDQWLVSQGTK